MLFLPHVCHVSRLVESAVVAARVFLFPAAEAATAAPVAIGAVRLVQQYTKSTAVCKYQHYIPGTYSVTAVASAQASGNRTPSPIVLTRLRNRNAGPTWILTSESVIL